MKPTVDTATRIREAAIARFVEFGFAGTGIRQLAEDVGITTASLYYHIDSKDDLLEEIIGSTMSAMIEAAELIVGQRSNPIDKLAALVRFHVDVHATYSADAIVVDRQLGAMKPDARVRAVAQRDRYESIWRRVIADGVDDGSFDISEPRLATLSILGSCTAVADWYRPSGRLEINRLAPEYVNFALRSVGALAIDIIPDISSGLAVFENRYSTKAMV